MVLEKSFQRTIIFIILNSMKNPLTLSKEGAKVKRLKHSTLKWKKRQEAIRKASDNGRCWWIEQYLKNVL